MPIEFDAQKDRLNVEKHGISLSRAADLVVLVFLVDERFEYGEVRFRAYGTIDGRDYCLACTIREQHVRAISLRRAHAKEMRRYVPRERTRH